MYVKSTDFGDPSVVAALSWSGHCVIQYYELTPKNSWAGAGRPLL